MEIPPKKLLEKIGLLSCENDMLRDNYIGLNKAVLDFLDSDKKIKAKWVALHGPIAEPKQEDGKKK